MTKKTPAVFLTPWRNGLSGREGVIIVGGFWSGFVGYQFGPSNLQLCDCNRPVGKDGRKWLVQVRE